MPDLDELRVLVALAKEKSISEAAASLNTSRARLRRKLASLEERTGVQLLVRVDGLLTPTEPGASLLKGARRLLCDASLLIAQAREIGTEPTGLLRVALQPGFPNQLALLAHTALHELYENLRVDLRVAEDPVTLLPEHADLAITIDEDLDPPGCTRLPLLSLRWQLLATEDYLRTEGSPATPEDLDAHRLLVWRPPAANDPLVHLVDGGLLQIRAAISSSNERLLLHLAAAGAGIAYVPKPPIPIPNYRALKPVLAESVGRSINAQMFVPNVLKEVPRVRMVLNAIADATFGSFSNDPARVGPDIARREAG